MIANLFRSNPNYLEIIMYDRGLATRLHELMATLFDLEETRMFGEVALYDEWPYLLCLMG